MTSKASNTAKDLHSAQGHPDEYDVDMSNLLKELEVSETKAYLQGVRHRERDALAGNILTDADLEEIDELYDFDIDVEEDESPMGLLTITLDGVPVQLDLENKQGVLDTIGFLSIVADKHPSQIPTVKAIAPDVWTVVDKLYSSDATILKPMVALLTKLKVDKPTEDDHEDVGHMFDNALELGASTVAVNIETAEETKGTLELIEHTLKEETLKSDELAQLDSMIDLISDKYHKNDELESIVTHLFFYSAAARVALSKGEKVKPYRTTEEVATERKNFRRKALASQVAELSSRGDYEEAYDVANKAAEEMPSSFLFAKGVFAKKTGKFEEAIAAFKKLEDVVLLRQDIDGYKQDSLLVIIKAQLDEIDVLKKRVKAYMDLTDRYYEQGRLKKAYEISGRAYQHFPNLFYKVWSKLGVLLLIEEEDERNRQADEIRREIEEMPVTKRLLRVTFPHPSPILGENYFFPLDDPEDVRKMLEVIRKKMADAEELTEDDDDAFTKIAEEVVEHFPENKDLEHILHEIISIISPKITIGDDILEVDEDDEDLDADAEDTIVASAEDDQGGSDDNGSDTGGDSGSTDAAAESDAGSDGDKGESKGKKDSSDKTKEIKLTALPLHLSVGNFEIPDEESEGAKKVLEEFVRKVLDTKTFNENDPSKLKETIEHLENKNIKQILGLVSNYIIAKLGQSGQLQIPTDSVHLQQAADRLSFFMAMCRGQGTLDTIAENLRNMPLKLDPDKTLLNVGAGLAKLSEALHTDNVLEIIFFGDEPEKTLQDMGFDIPTKKVLEDIIKEYLKEFGAKQGIERSPTGIDSLALASLDFFGVTPKNLAEFTSGLKERLPKKEEEVIDVDDSEVESHVTDIQITPNDPGSTTQQIDLRALAASMTSVVEAQPADTDKIEVAAAPEINPEAEIDALLEAIKEEAEFKELRRLIFLLRGARHKHADLDELRKQEFGTPEIKKVFELLKNIDPDVYEMFSNREDHFFADGTLDKKLVLKKLVESLSGEKTKEAVLLATKEVLRVLRDVANMPKNIPSIPPMPEGRPEDREEERIDESVFKVEAEAIPPVDVTAAVAPEEAPIEVPTEDRVDESVFAPEAEVEPIPAFDIDSLTKPLFKERTKLPEELEDLINKVAKNDAEKARLLDLWEVANGKAKFEDSALNEDVKKLFEQVRRLARDKSKSKFAEGRLEKIVTACEGKIIEALGEDELSHKELKLMLTKLAESNPKLQKKLEALFAMLEVDAEKQGDNAFALNSMKKDVVEFLLHETPEAMGIGECKNMAEFVANLDALGWRKQKKALKALEALVMKDEELTEMITEFNKMMGESPDKDDEPDGGGSGGSTPPAAPTPTAPPAAPAAPAAPVAPAAPSASARRVERRAVSVPSIQPMALNQVSTQMRAGNETIMASRVAKIGKLLGNLGFSAESKQPAIIAMMTLLSAKPNSEIDFEALQAFLKNTELTGNVDTLARTKSIEELEEKSAELKAAIESADDEIRIGRMEIQRLQRSKDIQQTGDDLFGFETVDLNEERVRTLTENLNLLRVAKEKNHNERNNYLKAIDLKQKGTTSETMHYSNPEQLLGMVNLYFATNEAKKNGETPDHMKVLERTQEQLAKVLKERSGVAHHLANFASFGVLKPRLTSTLRVIAEKDPNLKKVSAEQMDRLAKAWDDQAGVDAWINGLEGTKQEKMETIVPIIVGYLDTAVNAGRLSHLNTISIMRAKELAKRMRHSIHQYAMEQAKKTAGKGAKKMEVYFAHLNTINEKTNTVSKNILSMHTGKSMATNAFIGTGLSVGASALAGLAGVGLAAAGGLGVAGTAGLSSFRIQDPETRKTAQKMAVRATAMTALGVGGMAALGIGAVPALALVGLGAFTGALTPELFKHRQAIGSGTAKGAKVGAKIAVPVVGTSVRLGWGALGIALSGVTFGAALTNKRYRNFFGMP